MYKVNKIYGLFIVVTILRFKLWSTAIYLYIYSIYDTYIEQ